MSDVSGCTYNVTNASSQSITGSVTHSYDNTPNAVINFQDLKPGEATAFSHTFKSGTNHNDVWAVNANLGKNPGIVCNLKKDDQKVEVVLCDFGYTVYPELNNPTGSHYA